jgi:hypothetical protein
MAGVPPYEPAFLTETNERYWRDCAVISLFRMGAYAKPSTVVNNANREAFEKTGGHVSETPTLYGHWDKQTKEYFGHTAAIPRTWEALKASLTGEARGVIAGQMGNLTPHLKRWSPRSAADAGHMVNIGPYDPATNQFWWVDPLGRGSYVGEWVSAADVLKFGWGYPYWRSVTRYAWEPRPVPYVPKEGTDMIPVTPIRLYDTRAKQVSVAGTGGGRLAGGVPRRFQIAGVGPIPANAVLVAFAVAAVLPTVKGAWVHLSPETGVPVNLSMINAFESVTNGYPLLGLDATGGITVYCTSDVDVLIQVTAYCPPA